MCIILTIFILTIYFLFKCFKNYLKEIFFSKNVPSYVLSKFDWPGFCVVINNVLSKSNHLTLLWSSWISTLLNWMFVLILLFWSRARWCSPPSRRRCAWSWSSSPTPPSATSRPTPTPSSPYPPCSRSRATTTSRSTGGTRASQVPTLLTQSFAKHSAISPLRNIFHNRLKYWPRQLFRHNMEKTDFQRVNFPSKQQIV